MYAQEAEQTSRDLGETCSGFGYAADLRQADASCTLALGRLLLWLTF